MTSPPWCDPTVSFATFARLSSWRLPAAGSMAVTALRDGDRFEAAIQ